MQLARSREQEIRLSLVKISTNPRAWFNILTSTGLIERKILHEEMHGSILYESAEKWRDVPGPRRSSQSDNMEIFLCWLDKVP